VAGGRQGRAPSAVDSCTGTEIDIGIDVDSSLHEQSDLDFADLELTFVVS
jgi:hypothetical protein